MKISSQKNYGIPDLRWRWCNRAILTLTCIDCYCMLRTHRKLSYQSLAFQRHIVIPAMLLELSVNRRARVSSNMLFVWEWNMQSVPVC